MYDSPTEEGHDSEGINCKHLPLLLYCTCTAGIIMLTVISRPTLIDYFGGKWPEGSHRSRESGGSYGSG